MRWYGYALSFTISTHLVLDEAWIRIVTCLCLYLLYLRNTRVFYHAYVGLQVLGSVYIPEVNYIMMVLTVVVMPSSRPLCSWGMHMVSPCKP